MTNKTIHTAIAAPGAGKTQTVINKIPELIRHGRKIVMALPTLSLNNDILDSMTKANLKPRIINSKQDEVKHNKTSVTRAITDSLLKGDDNLIIITHDGLRRINPVLLRGYILIVDELPEIMDINHFTLNREDAEPVFAVTNTFNNQLQIKDNQLAEIKDRVKTYKTSIVDKESASTLSALEHKIFDALLTNNIVHYDTDTEEKTTFHIVVDKSVFPQIDQASETHVLAANIQGGMFDLFARKLGYQYKESLFTPKPTTYNCDIYIYPMLNCSWSKLKVLADNQGPQKHTHTGENNQIIDRIFDTALQHTPNEKFLVVRNSWAKFSENYRSSAKETRTEIKFVKMDCRGLNCFQDSTAALLLFSGKPSPNDRKSLKVLGDKHGIDLKDLIDAWVVKNKFEASLQAVTRTAIRTHGNTKPVYFYVQDIEVADYLKETYMKNAIIDDRLALTVTAKPDGRSATPSNEKTKAFTFIRHAIGNGTKPAKINKALIEIWNLPATTARRWTRMVQKSIRFKSAEGLEAFFE